MGAFHNDLSRGWRNRFVAIQRYKIGEDVDYGSSPERHGCVSVPILPFLIGRQWNDLAFNWMQAVEPISIRVIRKGDGVERGFRHRRVTITIDDSNLIVGIKQEVIVRLCHCDNTRDLLRQVISMGEDYGQHSKILHPG